MSAVWQGTLIHVAYDSLPHWIVDYGCYAVTLRCAGSLPTAVRQQLDEITQSLRDIDPATPEAEAFRRRQFAILENSLDVGEGFAPYKEKVAAEWLHGYLMEHANAELAFDAWVIMPNHVHLLTKPLRCESSDSFFQRWQRFKQSTGFRLNQLLDRQGAFWQAHWYDRWVRDAAEYARWVRYFRDNPIKAGLCGASEQYAYMKLTKSPPEN